MNKETILKQFAKEKWLKLFACILLDLSGNLSYFLPIIGDTIDIPFAPISGIILSALFWKYGKPGSIGSGVINFTEELLPFSDAIPSATLMWLLTFVKNENKSLKKLVDIQEEKIKIIS